MNDARTPGWPGGPMTVGRLLDRIWTILRGHKGLFIKLGVMPTAAMLALYAVMAGLLAAAGMFHVPPQPPDPARVLWIVFPGMLIIMVPMMLVFAVFQAATCAAALALHRGTEPASGDVYRLAWSKAGRYTWLVILCWLIVAAPMLLGGILLGGATLLAGRGGSDVNPGAWFIMVPLILLIYAGATVYMIWMTLRLGLAFPACVAEDLTAVEAIRRSSRLTVKAKGRMFLVLLVEWAISYAVMLVFEMVSMAAVAIVMLIGSAFHMQINEPLSIAILVVLGIIFMAAICLMSMLMWAAYAIGLSVIYEDQVLRIDGFPARPALSGAEPA